MKSILTLLKANKSPFIFVLWICIVAYAVASLNIIVHALLIYDIAQGAYLNPQSSLLYAILSFILVLLVAVYHISNMLRRRKRRTDRPKLSKGKALRAKRNAARKRVRELLSVTSIEQYPQ
jgi:membrane protein implicated in regulation of membrane protease activity